MTRAWRNPGHSSSISGVWRLNGLHPAPATSIQERWSERPGLSPRAWPACGAPSPPARERPAVTLLGVAYPDHPSWSGLGNPQHRPTGDGRRQRLKLDASRPADHLHHHSFGDQNLDRTPGLQAEVDLRGVPAGRGEIEPGRPDASADGCLNGQLPARSQLKTAVCCLQHEWSVQPPRGGCEPDQRWQRHHCCLKLGVAGSGEDLLQDSREALKRQLSAAEQVMEPGKGRDPGVFVNPIQRC